SGPAWSRDLDHAHIVEGLLGRIEIRILPEAGQHWSTDRICPGRALNVHRAADQRHLSSIRVGFAVARPSHVDDLLVCNTLAIEPAFDDLQPIKIGTVGVILSL